MPLSLTSAHTEQARGRHAQMPQRRLGVLVERERCLALEHALTGVEGVPDGGADRTALARLAPAAALPLARFDAGEDIARLKPVTVGNDHMGRPVVMPYIADGASPADWLSPARLEPRAEREAYPDFASTAILPTSANPGGAG